MSKEIEEVKELLKMFRLERGIYIVISITAFIALLFCMIYILFTSPESWPAILGLFGTAGGIGYSTGRLLRMWSDAINYLSKTK